MEKPIEGQYVNMPYYSFKIEEIMQSFKKVKFGFKYSYSAQNFNIMNDVEK